MKKIEGEKREKRICFRISESEYLQVVQNAGLLGVTPTRYCQLLALQTKVKAPKITPEIGRKLLAELGKLGSNANQIARALNQKAEPNDKMLNEVERIRTGLQAIWKELSDR